MTVQRRQAARPSVFCLAHAGGSAESAFRGWAEELADCAEVVALELAGRGRRSRETPFASVQEAAADCVQQILATAGAGAFLLFGHSMGGLLAYEIDALLHRCRLRRPSAIVIAGTPPPNRPRDALVLHALPDLSLLRAVEGLGGLPPELLEHRSSREFLVAVLREDYRIFERYAVADPPHQIAPLLLLLLGGADPLTRPGDPALWNELACGAVAIRTVPGSGHFFPTTHRQETVGLVRGLVRAVGGGPEAPRDGA
jgi:surfactin synthase thioesterase subunit